MSSPVLVHDEMYIDLMTNLSKVKRCTEDLHVEPNGEVANRDLVIQAIEHACHVSTIGNEIYRLYADRTAKIMANEHEDLASMLQTLLIDHDTATGLHCEGAN